MTTASLIMVGEVASTPDGDKEPNGTEQDIEKVKPTVSSSDRPQRVTAAFSMAHALRMMRSRQEEEKRLKEEEEKRQAELSKEKEREKRRRRRQNQKQKKAKKKAELEAKKPKLLPRVLLVKKKLSESDRKVAPQ